MVKRYRGCILSLVHLHSPKTFDEAEIAVGELGRAYHQRQPPPRRYVPPLHLYFRRFPRVCRILTNFCSVAVQSHQTPVQVQILSHSSQAASASSTITTTTLSSRVPSAAATSSLKPDVQTDPSRSWISCTLISSNSSVSTVSPFIGCVNSVTETVTPRYVNFILVSSTFISV